MRPLLTGLGCVVLLTGCGTRLTCDMWEADSPHYQPAQAAVITCKVVATPVTIVVDGTSALFSDPDFWFQVVYGVCEGCTRVACR